MADGSSGAPDHVGNWLTGYIDWALNDSPGMKTLNWAGNALGFGQAGDANAGKRDQDGFLVPGFGATKTTGSIRKLPNGDYRIQEKDLATGQIRERALTPQEASNFGVDPKASKAETAAESDRIRLETRQDQREGRRHEEVMAQLGLTGRQIQAGIDANRDSNQLGIATLQAQISQNEAQNRQRSLEFGETMRYQTTAMNQANALKAEELRMNDSYRTQALAETQRSNRLNAVMQLAGAISRYTG